tara:strand:+ start:57 stop:617 length:561 start_codon:yes stop_codon:yes gene_type:complete
MKYLFESNFYAKYQAPNADELIKKIDTYTDDSIDNAQFTWGDKSCSDKIPLKWQDYMELLTPSVKLFAKEFNVYFNFILNDPWINFYKRGDHQEVHDHHGNHLSSLFVANDGEGFSTFYFIDRHSHGMIDTVSKVINYNPSYNVKLKAGDIMFFPSYLLHGVSPHKSDIIRKTLSFNFDIKDVEKQ